MTKVKQSIYHSDGLDCTHHRPSDALLSSEVILFCIMSRLDLHLGLHGGHDQCWHRGVASDFVRRPEFYLTVEAVWTAAPELLLGGS